MGRLELLESREKSRKAAEDDKRNSASVFRQIDQDMGRSMNMFDLGGAPDSRIGRREDNFVPHFNDNPGLGVPKPKEMKLTVNKFSGTEQYKGLGSGFKEWGKRFLESHEYCTTRQRIFVA